MAGLLGKFVLLMLVVLPTTLMFMGDGGSSGMLVSAQAGDEDQIMDDVEDIAEGEDEGDATVETDEGTPLEPGTEVTEGEKEEEEEEEEKPLRPSPDADTVIHFTKPTGGTEMPAGALVKFLVGFTNRGDKDFVVETMDASFRYPQDYSFYIQNFTAVRYERLVEPSRQATFEYAFTPSETFNARPFGLTINLNYKDMDGNIFQDAVFNETINIVDADEGLDGETFFLYVFLAAMGVLLLVGAQQLLASFGKKRLSKPRQPIEMGTQNKGDVDYDWLPEGTVGGPKTSPKRSPRQSPGRRRSKRNAGYDE